MKSKLFNLVNSAPMINRQHIQMVMALVALVLLVLGAGAPDDGSSTVGR
ncbi:MAG: hypothetical protein ABIJ39_04385 [Chloroflexota bacterium]